MPERHDPFAFGGMAEAACDCILRHVKRGTQIVVHGDYDVDGVCSTAIAGRAPSARSAPIPSGTSRARDDGYGLSAATVERLALEAPGC